MDNIDRLISDIEQANELIGRIVPNVKQNGLLLTTKAINNIRKDPIGVGIDVAKAVIKHKLKDTCPWTFKY